MRIGVRSFCVTVQPVVQNDKPTRIFFKPYYSSTGITMAGRGRSADKRNAAWEMMEELKKDYDYEASRLMDEVNDFTTDVTKRIVIMRNIEDQLGDLARDLRMGNPRSMGGIRGSAMEALGLAFNGRYTRIGHWPDDLNEPGHWMENKRYKPRAEEDSRRAPGDEEFQHRGWHGAVSDPREYEEYKKGMGRSSQSDKAKWSSKRDASRGRPQTR